MPGRVGFLLHGFFIVLQLARQQVLNVVEGRIFFHFFAILACNSQNMVYSMCVVRKGASHSLTENRKQTNHQSKGD